MGMAALTSDMASQRWALQSTFLEAEAAAAVRLAQVEQLRAALESACGIRLPPAAGAAGASQPAQPSVSHPQAPSLPALWSLATAHISYCPRLPVRHGRLT